MQAAKDEAILRRAREEGRIVVSADTEFGALLAVQDADRPSFILFRETNLLVARDYFIALAAALPALEPELLAGCVAVFDTTGCECANCPSRNSQVGIRILITSPFH
jgi:predicted nuclease of predicted toxin-antitoxin system